jgi:hypothetical protein
MVAKRMPIAMHKHKHGLSPPRRIRPMALGVGTPTISQSVIRGVHVDIMNELFKSHVGQCRDVSLGKHSTPSMLAKTTLFHFQSGDRNIDSVQVKATATSTSLGSRFTPAKDDFTRLGWIFIRHHRGSVKVQERRLSINRLHRTALDPQIDSGFIREPIHIRFIVLEAQKKFPRILKPAVGLNRKIMN